MAVSGNLKKKAERLLKERRWRSALELYLQHLQQTPQDFEAWCAVGKAALQLDEHERAEQALRRAIELRPNLVEAYQLQAQSQLQRGYLREAVTTLRTATAFAPASQSLRQQQEQAQQLVQMLNEAEQLESQLRHDEELALLERLLALNPNAYEARWRHAELLLLLGRYREGWAAYEWRVNDPRWIAAMGRCEFAAPRWQGEPVDGKTILVYAEQGFGDAIQFSRYLQLLHERGAQIIFYVDRELLPLYQQSNIPMRVEAKSFHKALAESFDYHIPLMSLPHFFDTTVETIPAQIPYLQLPDEYRVKWQQRLSGEGFKIGMVWAGRDTHVNNQRRSCGLDALVPLSRVAGVQLYSLQKGSGALDQIAVPVGMKIDDLAPHLNDFGDTAAAIEQLDLVISVDTAVAHLAGALGKQIWTLIYHPSEWRWLLDRDDSPWYPTMRLFRQTAEDDGWAPVISRLVRELDRVASR